MNTWFKHEKYFGGNIVVIVTAPQCFESLPAFEKIHWLRQTKTNPFSHLHTLLLNSHLLFHRLLLHTFYIQI